MNTSIILNSDSYKYSQWKHYPPGTETVYSYIESRGGKWPSTVFFGLQAFIKEYLTKPITMYDIDEAEEIILAHGEPFNRAGWEYILKEYNGMLPVRIKAVPEGSIVPVRNVLATIENTDKNCAWLTSFLETPTLRAIWYPTTVATNSYESKLIILKWLRTTGDISDIDFKLHDFGSRGVSSLESSGLGGAAHLVNFKGTDNVAGLLAAKKYYSASMAGFSVPATEHSCVTSWGRDSEVDAYRHIIKAHPNGIVSIVSDSYDIYNACKIFGTELKDDIIKNNVNLVIRPDSGIPHEVVPKCLEILSYYFGYTLNEKNYKELNNVKVLQGDGITGEEINKICQDSAYYRFSVNNILFGQGGGLLQQLDRDTLKFAMKCSSVTVNGSERDVYKDPITDVGKKSKTGRVTLYKEDGEYYSGLESDKKSELVTVFENGELKNEISFEQVRKNACGNTG